MSREGAEVVAALDYGAIASRYRGQRDLLSFIKEVHRVRKGLSAEDIHGIAGAWGATPSEVYGIATFYSFIGTSPAGKYQVKICKSTPCCLKQCGAVADEVKKVLGISDGEITTDGLFSLMMVNCIGQCDGAPAMLVNGQPHHNLTPVSVRQVLEAYASHGMEKDANA